jgi:hypothetical protein
MSSIEKLTLKKNRLRTRNYFPSNQCSTFNNNSGFSFAFAAFMPVGTRLGPANCALNMAASPDTKTRPLPYSRAAN